MALSSLRGEFPYHLDRMKSTILSVWTRSAQVGVATIFPMK